MPVPIVSKEDIIAREKEIAKVTTIEKIADEIRRITGKEPSKFDIKSVLREREESIRWRRGMYHRTYCKSVRRVAPLASQLEERLLQSKTGEIKVSASEIGMKLGFSDAISTYGIHEFIKTPLISEFNIATVIDKDDKSKLVIKKITDQINGNLRFVKCVPYTPPPTDIKDIIKLKYKK